MKFSQGACVVIGILLILLILYGIMLCETGFPRQPDTDYPFPDSGTWVCEELGITLFLDTGKCTIKDGEDEIQCSMLRERGSDNVYIHCYEFDNLNYEFEHRFFSGDFLDVDGDVFHIQEHGSETVYIFCRVME